MDAITEKNLITEVIRSLLKRYPNAGLGDIYKSFFQDEYGLGHLLVNIDASRCYLEKELIKIVSKQRYDPEPCDLGKNFQRVHQKLWPTLPHHP